MHPMAHLHMLHRLTGYGVLGAAVWCAVTIGRDPTTPSRLRAIAWSLPPLVIAQIAIGLWSVRAILSVLTVSLHLGLGTLLWGLLAWLWLHAPASATAPSPTLAPTAG
jgi:heme A synthase